jgi:hypothetical protein
MKRERLEEPRIKYGARHLTPEEHREILAERKAAEQLRTRRRRAFQLGLRPPRNDGRRLADATVARLMRTIAECKALERQTWAKLTTYLATGRTIVRERLEEATDKEQQTARH